MSPVSFPVLGGAALVSSPALWRALVEGTATTQVALTRYLVSVLVCWAVLGLVATLVGPAPVAEREDEAGAEPDDAAEAARDAQAPASVS